MGTKISIVENFLSYIIWGLSYLNDNKKGPYKKGEEKKLPKCYFLPPFLL